MSNHPDLRYCNRAQQSQAMTDISTNRPRIAFIGFGEAGSTLAAGLREAGVTQIAAWDILFPEPKGEALKEKAKALGVRVARSAADAVTDADIVFSAVTASSSLKAADSVRAHIRPEQFFLDINSVSPARKREVGESMAGAVRYVDVAVMAPVAPARHRTPMLLAAPTPRRCCRRCSAWTCARASPGPRSARRRRSR
jgi:3-hydroxyisobutyrate dehydrogenase-like beta-hydroxyacid dehydrogenase